MRYDSLCLKRAFNVERIYSVHYFEFSKDYTFPGEAHDFWEFVYVDKGEIIATAGNTDYVLQAGEMICHCPMEWHNIRANGSIAPNVMIVSFRCVSPGMKTFISKQFQVDREMRNLLSAILAESRRAFSSALDDPYNNTLVRAKGAPFGCEQMIDIYLAELLILSYRKLTDSTIHSHITGTEPLLDEIILYLQDNVGNKLTQNAIAEHFHISPSRIKNLFAQYLHVGVMHFYINMKIAQAKEYLRQSDLNVSQIAEKLGYDNVYYFCNQFKARENMSPLEYRRSVKAIGDKALLQQTLSRD
ncbi:MAG: helix-turn-helix transcriptional regulator [Clostridia bacterium]|nr:helix-turn-helix transcriptional regulator [Clostridia bacterium]